MQACVDDQRTALPKVLKILEGSVSKTVGTTMRDHSARRISRNSFNHQLWANYNVPRLEDSRTQQDKPQPTNDSRNCTHSITQRLNSSKLPKSTTKRSRRTSCSPTHNLHIISSTNPQWSLSDYKLPYCQNLRAKNLRNSHDFGNESHHMTTSRTCHG